MAKHKNQHFVPRCHLKPFTLNNEGLAINVYNHKNDRTIENAAVKNQCSRSYFYGKDLQLENILRGIEGEYARIIRKLSEKSDSLSKGDLITLKNFAYLQMHRTEANVRRRSIAHQTFDELAHQGFEKYRKEILDISHERILRGAMQSYVDTSNTIKDLKVLIIANRTRHDFITSDDPSVLTNRLYLQRLAGRPFGMISCGVQLVMPITPRFCLICYDDDTYIPLSKSGYTIAVDKGRDVHALNELQFIRSSENVFFQKWDSRDEIRKSFLLVSERRPSSWLKFWVGIPTGNENGSKYFRRANGFEIPTASNRLISYHSLHVSPSRWVSMLPYRSKIYGYTNGSGVSFVRKGQIDHFENSPFWEEQILFSAKKFKQDSVMVKQ